MVERIFLEPGDTVVFDNHRALHGRESFKVPGVFGDVAGTRTPSSLPREQPFRG
ncbi:unnamed protein product [Scytosiphon promiscuus]